MNINSSLPPSPPHLLLFQTEFHGVTPSYLSLSNAEITGMSHHVCVKFKGQIQVPALPCLPTCLRWTVIDLPQTPDSRPTDFSYSPVCASSLPVAVSGFDVGSRDLNSGTHTLSHLSSSRLISPSISVCVCTHDVCVWTGMSGSTCRHQRTSLWSWFSHSTFRWVLGIKLGLPDCVANSFTCRVILLALN